MKEEAAERKIKCQKITIMFSIRSALPSFPFSFFVPPFHVILAVHKVQVVRITDTDS